jgi:hypothetical protein
MSSVTPFQLRDILHGQAYGRRNSRCALVWEKREYMDYNTGASTPAFVTYVRRKTVGVAVMAALRHGEKFSLPFYEEFYLKCNTTSSSRHMQPVAGGFSLSFSPFLMFFIYYFYYSL